MNSFTPVVNVMFLVLVERIMPSLALKFSKRTDYLLLPLCTLPYFVLNLSNIIVYLGGGVSRLAAIDTATAMQELSMSCACNTVAPRTIDV